MCLKSFLLRTSVNASLISDIDLIIAEGWKSQGFPKVIVVREELQEVDVSLEGLIAVASIKPIEVDVPWFDRDDVHGLAQVIITRFPRQADL